LIVISIMMAAAGFVVGGLWWPALTVFIVGWVLQFIGHYFEGEPPEFFKDWRFLFVGLRWWLAKISGKAYPSFACRAGAREWPNAIAPPVARYACALRAGATRVARR